MRKRSEMDPKFTWDFTHIYKDDAAWEQGVCRRRQGH